MYLQHMSNEKMCLYIQSVMAILYYLLKVQNSGQNYTVAIRNISQMDITRALVCSTPSVISVNLWLLVVKETMRNLL